MEIGDEMSKDLTTATNEETTAIKDYEELTAANEEERDRCATADKVLRALSLRAMP